MKRLILATAASLTLLSADLVQAQTSSRRQAVRTTRTTQTQRHSTTTRTDSGRHTGWEKGKHKGWEMQTDTVRARHGGYHRQKPR